MGHLPQTKYTDNLPRWLKFWIHQPCFHPENIRCLRPEVGPFGMSSILWALSQGACLPLKLLVEDWLSTFCGHQVDSQTNLNYQHLKWWQSNFTSCQWMRDPKLLATTSPKSSVCAHLQNNETDNTWDLLWRATLKNCFNVAHINHRQPMLMLSRSLDGNQGRWHGPLAGTWQVIHATLNFMAHQLDPPLKHIYSVPAINRYW